MTPFIKHYKSACSFSISTSERNYYYTADEYIFQVFASLEWVTVCASKSTTAGGWSDPGTGCPEESTCGICILEDIQNPSGQDTNNLL